MSGKNVETGQRAGDDGAGTDGRPNLLLVCVDCLRQDFTRREQVETPFIDEIGRAHV